MTETLFENRVKLKRGHTGGGGQSNMASVLFKIFFDFLILSTRDYLFILKIILFLLAALHSM